MADLVKDMGIGKKFSLHDKLIEQERLKRQKALEKKRQKKNGNANGAGSAENEDGTPRPEGGDSSTSQSNGNIDNPDGTPNPDNPTANEREESTGLSSTQRAPVGESYRIVNGEIVVDEQSLQVDRHARAAAEQGELEEQEENEFTHAVNSSTYLRRNMKPQQWTEEETERFYAALSSWGTDFEMISKLFPNKQRKHVKLKFNREERINRQRIDDALTGKKTGSMDMEEYMRNTGVAYETTEAIDEELRREREEFDEKERLIREEQEEVNRKKREELFGGNKDGENGGKQKQRGRGRKQKQIATW